MERGESKIVGREGKFWKEVRIRLIFRGNALRFLEYFVDKLLLAALIDKKRDHFMRYIMVYK